MFLSPVFGAQRERAHLAFPFDPRQPCAVEIRHSRSTDQEPVTPRVSVNPNWVLIRMEPVYME